MTRGKIIDQVQGLVYGVAVSVLLAVATQITNAGDGELFTKAFLVGLALTAVRSGGTAVLTLLKVRVPGVSGG